MKLWKYIFGLLFLATAALWLAAAIFPDSNLHLIACDVGQGDAILAVYKNFEILTDGGIPNNKVIDCLGRHLPFWDREIEVVVNTHPQLDHYGGLIEVVKRYKVDNFIANALDSSSTDYQVLKKEVGGRGIRVVNPTTGTKVSLGLMHLDIFWPTQQFLENQGWDGVQGKLGTFTSKRDPNDFSVQAILSFGEFDALLTGDIGHNMADEVIPQFLSSSVLKSVEYIKVPHHGSKNGMTPDYLNIIDPKLAVISVGKNNRYGHPHEVILKLLLDKGIKTLRTDRSGDIEIITDGKRWWIR